MRIHEGVLQHYLVPHVLWQVQGWRRPPYTNPVGFGGSARFDVCGHSRSQVAFAMVLTTLSGGPRVMG